MKNHQYQEIQRKVASLLRQSNCTEAPVNVEEIASSLNIELRKAPAEDDLSGFLLKRPDGTAVVGVNARHHPNRQRFTIGHEIGHYLLHQYDEVHVDKFVIKLRDGNSSTGENEEEVEANRFAAELLMPRQFIERDLFKYAVDGQLDDRKLAQFAKQYEVSVQAMTNRLVSLGFIYDGNFQ